MDLPAPYLLLVALLVIGVLGLVLRWAFATDEKRDYGLLREVAKVPSRTAARFVEDRLRGAGIRATTVPSADGDGLRILVFPADEKTAIAALLDD
ncbi:hypothetical protein [Actinokineospora enzanensis]|uniref:hypothetical protein n=1 Tax=Actinokineospora enzanensis TaxID=155975 RepID=UPI00039E9B73|nr:hypothetical protein [Actinokineospora enzanensis]